MELEVARMLLVLECLAERILDASESTRGVVGHPGGAEAEVEPTLRTVGSVCCHRSRPLERRGAEEQKPGAEPVDLDLIVGRPDEHWRIVLPTRAGGTARTPGRWRPRWNGCAASTRRGPKCLDPEPQFLGERFGLLEDFGIELHPGLLTAEEVGLFDP